MASDTPIDQLFPALTAAPIARLSAHGSRQSTEAGDVLFDAGDPVVPFFVVLAGRIEIERPSGSTATPITALGPGQFTGETNMLSGYQSPGQDAGRAVQVGS